MDKSRILSIERKPCLSHLKKTLHHINLAWVESSTLWTLCLVCVNANALLYVACFMYVVVALHLFIDSVVSRHSKPLKQKFNDFFPCWSGNRTNLLSFSRSCLFMHIQWIFETFDTIAMYFSKNDRLIGFFFYRRLPTEMMFEHSTNGAPKIDMPCAVFASNFIDIWFNSINDCSFFFSLSHWWGQLSGNTAILLFKICFACVRDFKFISSFRV